MDRHMSVGDWLLTLNAIKHGLLERRWGMLGRVMPEAYRKGRDAAQLMGIVWEDRWAEPNEAVRRRYNIAPVLPS